MRPDLEARLERVLDVMEKSPDRHEVVLTEIGKLAAKIDTNEVACSTRHRESLGHTDAVKVRVTELEAARAATERESKAAINEQLKTALDSQKHWVRWVVGALVALVSSGGLFWLSRALGK